MFIKSCADTHTNLLTEQGGQAMWPKGNQTSALLVRVFFVTSVLTCNGQQKLSHQPQEFKKL